MLLFFLVYQQVKDVQKTLHYGQQHSSFEVLKVEDVVDFIGAFKHFQYELLDF